MAGRRRKPAPLIAGDVEHALDVTGQLGWAWFFSRGLGAPDPALRAAAMALYRRYDAGVNHGIRPAGPAAGVSAYRVSPRRTGGWEHRTSDGLAFTLGAGGAAAAAPQPADIAPR